MMKAFPKRKTVVSKRVKGGNFGFLINPGIDRRRARRVSSASLIH